RQSARKSCPMAGICWICSARGRRTNKRAGASWWTRRHGYSETRSVGHHFLVSQIDRDHVVAGLLQRARADLVESDHEFLLVDVDAQKAVVVICVFLEPKLLGRDRSFFPLHIIDATAGVRLLRRLSLLCAHQRIDVV